MAYNPHKSCGWGHTPVILSWPLSTANKSSASSIPEGNEFKLVHETDYATMREVAHVGLTHDVVKRAKQQHSSHQAFEQTSSQASMVQDSHWRNNWQASHKIKKINVPWIFCNCRFAQGICGFGQLIITHFREINKSHDQAFYGFGKWKMKMAKGPIFKQARWSNNQWPNN